MSTYARHARYVPVEKGFNIKRPAIEPKAFTEECERAFAAKTPTGLIALDLGDELGSPFPATTPFMLARYARIRSCDRLACRFRASGEMWAVLRGRGRLRLPNAATIDWRKSDMFALPGGARYVWEADEDSVLWGVTDEPVLAFLGVRPERFGAAPIDVTHYTSDAVSRELRRIYRRPMAPDTPGRAVFMASSRTRQLGTCLPAMTLTLNAVRPGEAQRPHRHNAAALLVALRGADCTSVIADRRFRWREHVTVMTPAGAVHSHRNARNVRGRVNDGDIALALIVQDGGLYYHGRTMGFSFA